MKQYLSLLAACLLAGCSAGPQATESVPQTLRSSYQCDVPQAQTFPPLQTAADLVVNMRHLSQHAQARNFVAGQWLTHSVPLPERDRINACSTQILQASRQIIDAQYQTVYPTLNSQAQRDALKESVATWRVAMQGITPQGVNDTALSAFNTAAERLLALLQPR
ncbi:MULTISPECIES: hypothetical protein [Edwardsiella]|uniref:Lipoprotein n=2 Tax=Edwardsiella anguillarum TaxID=1821960 RepID=A0A076LUA4_9GAMM|nr:MULTISPECIES: hypothetical protein [Edwardsiella]AIJ10272.1 Hypothetical protein ETEE_3862 [Edwardsiella anguillarum ET080813]AKR77819.1 hypothetical protein AAZ33_09295 [Edwardsiella sp. LADL05-105]KAB0592064.1 hypothetical protein F7P84_06815 [Edwardsiella anguillarum]UOU77492.1 hypothetical protein MUN71_10470 [Edwardsiella anguillarum]WHP78732.1 hypothetical protein MQ090_09330 [Edwardsiella anguillarum]